MNIPTLENLVYLSLREGLLVATARAPATLCPELNLQGPHYESVLKRAGALFNNVC
jgi:hypothetical protein